MKKSKNVYEAFMKKGMLTFFVIASLVAIAIYRTDGFSPEIIHAPLLSPCTKPLSEEAKLIFSRPFHYLGKGRQSFVFESEDGKYVLKFFNQTYLKRPWYTVFIGDKERKKRDLRRFFYENSYEIALREFGDEIVYLHLGSSEKLPLVFLVDQASRHFCLDLTTIPFVLQRKGVLIFDVLRAIYEKEGIEGICHEIDVYLSLVSQRIAKNIADADQDIEHNWGYIEGRLFQLDPGRLHFDALEESKRRDLEWQRATRGLLKWLHVHCPEGAKYLQNQLPAS